MNELILIPFIKKKSTKNKKEKKNRIDAVILFSIIEVFLVASIVILFYVTIPLQSTKVLFIPKGSTNSIITYLNKSGYELNNIDKLIIKFIGYPQSGWIDLKQTQMVKADFLKKILKSKAALRSVTLIPGETSYFFLQELAKKFNLSHDKLVSAYAKYAYKVDGNILAETYNLPLGMKEDHMMYYLMSFSEKKYKEFSHKIFGEYNKETWYRYISIASVIQKEAASIKEMPIVSSVIQNRLKKGMPLQMDGTLNYGKFSHTKVTAKMIREDNSSYNTYKSKDIPKNPVCAVSLDAIKAAIFPAKTDYLYFVKDQKTGLHRFSKSYKSHVKNINDYRKQKQKAVFPKEKTKPKVLDTKELWKSVQ